MKNLFVQPSRLVLMALVAAFVAAVSGCSTPEPTNRSARPWNAPKSWEGGIPSSLTEGR